jgi:hypothetical protein
MPPNRCPCALRYAIKELSSAKKEFLARHNAGLGSMTLGDATTRCHITETKIFIQSEGYQAVNKR